MRTRPSRRVTCEPVTIRVVSNIETKTKFSDQMERQSSMATKGATSGMGADKVKEFPYRSKCILAFQRVQGHEICFFAMYVQEYGSDCPEPNTNRVYISDLDSVRYFESSPEGHRTTVYHSMLISYLQYAKDAGYTHAHIWVAPPKQGDDYIFFCHPEDQKVPKDERLRKWYMSMLQDAENEGIVKSVTNIYDEYLKNTENIATVLPYFEGDYWVGEIESLIEALEARTAPETREHEALTDAVEAPIASESRAPKPLAFGRWPTSASGPLAA